MHDPRLDIDQDTRRALCDTALRLADSARTILRSTPVQDITTQRKADGSVLTNMDLAVERQLRTLIEQHWPEHGILGEEFPLRHPQAPFRWVLDPIDGTEDFTMGLPTFGTILALYYRGLPLVGVIDQPLLDDRAWATYGLGTYRNGARVHIADLPAAALDGSERVMLSARANFIRYRNEGHLFDAITRAHPNVRIYRTCYAHLCAATGVADAMVGFHDRLWDVAASRILVEEAGGKYVQLQDFSTPDGGRVYSVVFGKPTLVNAIVDLLATTVSNEAQSPT